jgi:C-terminal processing protease CtpA/Prc
VPSFRATWATALFVVATGLAQAAPEISAEAAQRDLHILKNALLALHPGLYRYATAAQIDSAFATAEQAVANGSDRGQMYLLASRLAATVRCGHTWTNRYNQADAVKRAVFEANDKLPFTLRWVQGRALITGSMAPDVAAGAELLAIDGKAVAEIAHTLLPYIRADGNSADSDGKRWSQLDSGANGGAMDSLFPLRFPATGKRYTLRLRNAADVANAANATAREVTVATVSVAERERQLPSEDTAWQFRIDGDTAVLTLPTFAFWRGDFKPADYLARSFETLRNTPAVRFLIIDQRRNEGGDDNIGRQLLSYLLRQPFTQAGSRVESAYERVPYELARYLDTWNFGFFDRTGQVSKSAGRNWLLSDAPARRIEPVATPFAGRTIVLVGPQNSSAGFLLARDVKASGAATLMGQATGGNQRGLNGGQLAWLTLPASGVAVDIPLIAGFSPGDPPDAGITPDVVVQPNFEHTQTGIDSEMQAAKSQITRWRQQNK